MRFFIETPERSRERLQSFPEYFQRGFLSARKLFLLGLSDDGETIAACGISNLSNYLLIYVNEEWQGKGVGTKILGRTISISQRRGINFIALAVRPNNLPALRLYHKFDFREVVNLKEFGFILMIRPFTLKGEIVYGLSRAVCLVIPKSILVYTVICSRTIVGSIRGFLR
jgi:GNAT superfamily N-acetyltransferase